eukprot:TRINITY_DN36608_c0_g1_i1.p1 TRINITY_DN36608_c0_g1~~TRINITY_DN36608_c0_g1_i1.p1  ORF type:complete len:508 (-),score=115.35 TRINITY_DN36608_c0_g1_i1:14-1537(-)
MSSTDVERLDELQRSYSELAQSMHKPSNTKYLIMWDIGSLCSYLWPSCLMGNGLQQAKPKTSSAAVRKELGRLREKVNQQRWSCWDSDGSGMEVEVSMLSGRTWRFIIGEHAQGAEVKERVAALSGIHRSELGLFCGGREVDDSEVLLNTLRQELQGPAPQLQLLRLFRPFALTCSTDCYLKLWDLDRAVCVDTLRGHGDGVTSLAVDWASRYAVSGSHDCTLRMWDLEHGICVQEIQLNDHPAFCLDFDQSSRRAVTGSWDNMVKLWDLESGVCVSTFSGHEGMVKAVRLHWASFRVLSGSCDGTLRVWDLQAGSCKQLLEGHSGEVWAADVDWAASRAVSGSQDATLRLWDLCAGTCLATLTGHTDAVSCVALKRGAGEALSASWDRSVRFWDLCDLACLMVLQNGSPVTSLSVDWQTCRAAAGSPEAMKIWDLSSGSCTRAMNGHAGSEAHGYTDDGTSVSVGHMEAVTCLVINSPEDFEAGAAVRQVPTEKLATPEATAPVGP